MCRHIFIIYPKENQVDEKLFVKSTNGQSENVSHLGTAVLILQESAISWLIAISKENISILMRKKIMWWTAQKLKAKYLIGKRMQLWNWTTRVKSALWSEFALEILNALNTAENANEPIHCRWLKNWCSRFEVVRPSAKRQGKTI